MQFIKATKLIKNNKRNKRYITIQKNNEKKYDVFCECVFNSGKVKNFESKKIKTISIEDFYKEFKYCTWDNVLFDNYTLNSNIKLC